MIKLGMLAPATWKEYRDLRLQALRTEPRAFGSSYEEERVFTEEKWRERIKGVMFATSDGTPVGAISYVFSDRVKTRHVAMIFGFYVIPRHRGEGIGRRLLERALSEIRKNKDISKVHLSVNPLLRPAVKLYREAGFEVTGRARKELKIGNRYFDLLYMEKEL